MAEILSNRLPEIEIDYKEPFKGDRLGREQYAVTLANIVNAYSETGCVLSVNGEWGTGKTTFIKMWQAYLMQKKYRTIYYNAWETDYIEDPLISILGELKSKIGDDEKFRKVSSSIGHVFLSIGKSFVKNKVGIDIDDITEDVKKQIDAYSQQKTTLNEFKKALIEYVANVDEDEQLPVIFIIDELDRCNPHFAVKVLERVKHLFDIPNIVFVLPISKKQFEYSIQGYYGSDKIDATNYLRRFIDLECELPTPDSECMCQLLYDHYYFDDFFKEKYKGNHEALDGRDLFKSMVIKLCKYKRIELRTLDKIFVLCRIVATEIYEGEVAEMDLYFLLCHIKVCEYDFYCDIRQSKLKLQEIVNYVEKNFPKELLAPKHQFSNDHHSFLFAIATLLQIYNRKDCVLLEKDVLPSNSNSNMGLNCTIIDKKKLKEGLEYATTHFSKWSNINEITDKIDLLRIR